MVRRSLVVGAVLAVILLPLTSDALRITYRGMEGVHTDQEQQDIFNWLLLHHSPELALAVMQQMSTVSPRSTADDGTVTIREQNAGEMLFCHLNSVLGTGSASGTMETLRGDGSFFGAPSDTVTFTWGTVMMYHGVPSTSARMTVNMSLAFTQ